MFNNDPLMIAARQKITGKFNQSAMGSLIFGLAGDMAGQYGALDISGSASLAGGLGFDLTNDFTLAAGDTFDDLLMSGGALSGRFRAPVARWRPLLGDICRRLALQQRRARSRSQHRERRARRGRSQRRRARLRRRQVRIRQRRRRPRALDLGDARVGLPRPRRAYPAQARGPALSRTIVAGLSALEPTRAFALLGWVRGGYARPAPGDAPICPETSFIMRLS